MKIKFYFILCFISAEIFALNIPKDSIVIPLFPNITIDSKEKIRVYEPTGDHVVTNVHNPTITAFLPSKENATGIAIIIAPGGGHRELWIDHEGYNIAKKLRDNGIAAFVLKYRLANEDNSNYSVEKHSVIDMQQAIKIVRNKSTEWNINVNKIGVMGFSAGGEV